MKESISNYLKTGMMLKNKDWEFLLQARNYTDNQTYRLWNGARTSETIGYGLTRGIKLIDEDNLEFCWHPFMGIKNCNVSISSPHKNVGSTTFLRELALEMINKGIKIFVLSNTAEFKNLSRLAGGSYYEASVKYRRGKYDFDWGNRNESANSNNVIEIYNIAELQAASLDGENIAPWMAASWIDSFFKRIVDCDPKRPLLGNSRGKFMLIIDCGYSELDFGSFITDAAMITDCYGGSLVINSSKRCEELTNNFEWQLDFGFQTTDKVNAGNINLEILRRYNGDIKGIKNKKITKLYLDPYSKAVYGAEPNIAKQYSKKLRSALLEIAIEKYGLDIGEY